MLNVGMVDNLEFFNSEVQNTCSAFGFHADMAEPGLREHSLFSAPITSFTRREKLTTGNTSAVRRLGRAVLLLFFWPLIRASAFFIFNVNV